LLLQQMTFGLGTKHRTVSGEVRLKDTKVNRMRPSVGTSPPTSTAVHGW